MSKLLGEVLKIDQAIAPQPFAPTDMVISRFFPMARERKALIAVQFVSPDFDRADVLDIGVVDDTVVPIVVTTDLAGRVAAHDPGVRSYHQIVPGVRSSALSVDVGGAGDGALTINGVVFPYDAAPGLPATGEWDDGPTLVLAIDALLPGLLATHMGADVVLIVSRVAGEQTITLVSTVTAVIDADIVCLEAVAYLEVDASELVPLATTIAVVIDNVGATGTIAASAALVRGDARYVPVPQAVA